MFILPDEAGLEHAAALLRAGEIVAVPTETVYGLAANALDETAVRKIFEAKGRPFIDPLIVHVADLEMALQLAENTPALEKLAIRFWPGPLTVILKKRPCVPDLVTAGEPTVAIRIPSHPVMRDLIRRAGLPLAAPSANPFGYVSPTTAGHVLDSLGDRAPHILDGGPCRHGLESTIVNLADPAGVRLLRPGPVDIEHLEAALGVSVLPAPSHMDKNGPQTAPGMLDRHYSPDTPMMLRTFGTAADIPSGIPGRIAVVHQARPEKKPSDGADHFWFSESGSPEDVARSLFALIRRLDTKGYAVILAEAARPGGLGDAVNDRLKRAAAKR